MWPNFFSSRVFFFFETSRLKKKKSTMYNGTTPGFKPQCGQTFFFSSSCLFLNFKIKSTMYHGTTPGFKPRVALFFFSFSFLFLQHLKYQSACTTVRLLQYRVNLEDIHTYPLLYMKINFFFFCIFN